MSEPEKSKNGFTISESYYKAEIVPKIPKWLTPCSLLHFKFNLPFQFPVKNGTTFDLGYTNNCYFFHCDKFEDASSEPRFQGEPGLRIAKMRTRVEAALVSKDAFPASDQQGVYSHLVHLLGKLNGFINAYRLLFEDWKTFPLTPETLHSVISYQIIKVSDWSVIEKQPLLINENYINIITNLPQKLSWVVGELGGFLVNGKNPLSAAHLHFADARTHLFNGFYREAVLACQMAIESTIRVVFRAELGRQKLTEAQIDDKVERTPFMQLVKQEMPRILGGNWNVTDKTSPMSQWYSVVYKRRNNIIHAAYFPFQHEAYECFKIACECLQYIDSLLASKKDKYPSFAQAAQFLPGFFLRGQEIERGESVD